MEIGMVFPILPGKREALMQFAQTVLGDRRAEYEASQATVQRESWFLQPTPQGDLLVVHFEADDIAAVFEGLATSQEPFDVWFRAQVLDLTGVDMTQPPPGLPMPVFQWKR